MLHNLPNLDISKGSKHVGSEVEFSTERCGLQTDGNECKKAVLRSCKAGTCIARYNDNLQSRVVTMKAHRCRGKHFAAKCISKHMAVGANSSQTPFRLDRTSKTCRAYQT